MRAPVSRPRRAASRRHGAAGRRAVIFNADDFGMSDAVNRGVIAAHMHGVVTSASLMVHGGAAEAAVEVAGDCPGLALGLHLDLGEWIRRDRGWEPRSLRVPPDDPDAVARELDRQLRRFRQLVGRDPTHLDSHQHVHDSEPAQSVARAVSSRIGVPLRGHCAQVRHEGGFYGQDRYGNPFHAWISPGHLETLLRGLPAGITEIGCHPAAGPVPDPYGAERSVELKTLCHPDIAATLRGESIELVSFREFHTVGEPCVFETGQ